MKIATSGVPVGGVAGSGVFAGESPTVTLKPSWNGTATVGGTTVYYQGTDANLHTCELDGSNDQTVPNVSGISLITASSTVWAVWLTSGKTVTSWGQSIPGAVPLAATEDGGILLLSDYANGQGLKMITPTGDLWSLPHAHPVVWYPYPQAFALDRFHVVYYDTAAGALRAVGLPQPQTQGTPFDPFLVTQPNSGDVWLGYHTYQLMLHPIADASKGYILATGETFGTSATGQKVGYGLTAGETQLKTLQVDWSQPLVSLSPPPPPKPIGPTGPPLPEGTEIDLAPLLIYDPAVWPRGGNKTNGDDHAYDMQPVIHKGEPCFWHAVFGDDGKGRLGSLVQIKDGFLHLLSDCHNRDNTGHPDGPFIDTWSDTRWIPLKMRVGRKYSWTAPDHTIRKHREDGTIFKEYGSSKEHWVHEARMFWCGESLGERMAVRFAQNNTGIKEGQTTTIPGLGMESDYLVMGAGRCRWTYDRAMDVFVGPNHAPIFPDPSQAQSDFWHVGGPRYPPVIPPWIPLATEAPPVPPIPPIPPTPMPTDTLLPGQNILADRPLVSTDKRFRLLYQRDGNLVLYGPSGPLWATGTSGQSVGFVSLQGDGNLVVYNGAIKPVWASATNGKPVQRLLVQNDGNVVMYSATAAVWATNTVYVPPPIPPGPQPQPVVPIRVEGKYFRRPDGAIHGVRSASSFLMLRRLLEEPDEIGVRTDLQKWARLGYNELRVFSRVDWFGSPGPGLFPEQYPNYWEKFHRLFTLAAENGLYIEIVALTGCIPNRDNPDYGAMAGWVNRVEFERRQHANTFLEVCNEPPVNGVDIERLMSHLDTSSWAKPWATGQYWPTAMPSGSYCTVHTDRVDGWDWVRKAGKDLLEYREGGGPNEPSDPAMLRPIVGDEPMGAASFLSPGRRDNVPFHHYTAGALSTLFGAGYCCHHESGLNSVFPSGLELECVIAAAEGMKAVNPIYQTGQYSRVGLAEFPIVEDPSVRTYGMLLNGVWQVVRVGPTTTWPVLAGGWKIVNSDSYNVVMQVVPA